MRRRLYPDQVVNYRDLVRHNLNFRDHQLRTYATAASIAYLRPMSVADPAVGDGTILEAAHRIYPITTAWVSDLSTPNIEQLHLSFPHHKAVIDINMALKSLPEQVDVIVLTEILEHLEDPDAVLRLAREHGKALVASSPLEEPEGVVNHEHLWSFGRDGYQSMLTDAGWDTFSCTEVGFPGDPELYYTFQIWVCR